MKKYYLNFPVFQKLLNQSGRVLTQQQFYSYLIHGHISGNGPNSGCVSRRFSGKLAIPRAEIGDMWDLSTGDILKRLRMLRLKTPEKSAKCFIWMIGNKLLDYNSYGDSFPSNLYSNDNCLEQIADVFKCVIRADICRELTDEDDKCLSIYFNLANTSTEEGLRLLSDEEKEIIQYNENDKLFSLDALVPPKTESKSDKVEKVSSSISDRTDTNISDAISSEENVPENKLNLGTTSASKPISLSEQYTPDKNIAHDGAKLIEYLTQAVQANLSNSEKGTLANAYEGKLNPDLQKYMEQFERMRGTSKYSAFLIVLLYCYKNNQTGCTAEQASSFAEIMLRPPIPEDLYGDIEPTLISLVYDCLLYYRKEDDSYCPRNFETLKIVLPEKAVLEELGYHVLEMYRDSRRILLPVIPE